MNLLPRWMTYYIERVAAEDTFRHIRRYLYSQDTVLDVGSGTGIAAELLRQYARVKVECLDVEDMHDVGPAPRLYDGTTFPYPDDTFPFVLCAFVLHHAKRQEILLDEMHRVSSSRVCVLEDIPVSLIDKILLFFHQRYSRVRYHHPTTAFRSVTEWKGLFLQHGLRVQETVFLSRKRQVWNPVTRAMFLLEKA